MEHAYKGLPLFAGGYRIFFFAAAVWAIVALVFWLFYLAGFIANVDADMLQWHAHELVFGYGGAVVAGFALTAIPNWTGRPSISGWLLGALFLPWLVARIASLLMLAGYANVAIPALVEAVFFTGFLGLATREVIAAKNTRNYKVIAFFGLLVTAAIVANLERTGVLDIVVAGWRGGLAALILLVSVIGGRIIPAFTGNWMRLQHMAKLPVPFSGFDAVCILVTIAALGLFVGDYDGTIMGVIAALAAGINLIRMVRWRGWKTLKSPIVAVLHISYLWIVVGFLLLALAAYGVVAQTAALHAWTIGGVGGMTLAVMSRASLGHAGLPLENSAALTSIYLAINLAAVTRVSAGIWFNWSTALIELSGLLWSIAFLLFVVRFAPIYFKR